MRPNRARCGRFYVEAVHFFMREILHLSPKGTASKENIGRFFCETCCGQHQEGHVANHNLFCNSRCNQEATSTCNRL